MIFTDHKNLEYLRTAKHLRPYQARWAFFFCRFNFHITYRPGSKNRKADALSRTFPDTPRGNNDQYNPANTELPANSTWSKNINWTGLSSEYRARGIVIKKSMGGFLWHQDKIFVPQQTRLQVLKTFHGHKLAGHFRVRKTSKLIQRSLWWPTLKMDCKNVNSCTTCQHNKGFNTKSWGLFRSLLWSNLGRRYLWILKWTCPPQKNSGPFWWS